MSAHCEVCAALISHQLFVGMPPELFLEVMKALPAMERNKVAGTSRRFRAAAYERGIVCLIGYLNKYAFETQLGILRDLLDYGESGRPFRLDLVIAHTGNYLVQGPPYIEKLISELPRTLPFIRKLVVDTHQAVTTQVLEALVSGPAPRLKTLALGSWLNPLTNTVPEALFKKAPGELWKLEIDIYSSLQLNCVPAFHNVTDVLVRIHQRRQAAPCRLNIAALVPSMKDLDVRTYHPVLEGSISISGSRHPPFVVVDAYTKACFEDGSLDAALGHLVAPSLDQVRERIAASRRLEYL